MVKCYSFSFLTKFILECENESFRFRLLQLLCWILPLSHRIILEYTLDLLALIAHNSGTNVDMTNLDKSGNLMDSKNLAMCIGPTLIRDKNAMIDYERGVEEIRAITRILQTLIDFHRRLWILPSEFMKDMINTLGDQTLQTSPDQSKM